MEFFNIFSCIGHGYREKVYCQAIIEKLYENGISFKYQVQVPVVLNGKVIAKRYMDFLIENKIVIEVKVGDRIPRGQFNQLEEYLKLTKLKLGLLVAFRRNEAKVFRVLNLY